MLNSFDVVCFLLINISEFILFVDIWVIGICKGKLQRMDSERAYYQINHTIFYSSKRKSKKDILPNFSDTFGRISKKSVEVFKVLRDYKDKYTFKLIYIY